LRLTAQAETGAGMASPSQVVSQDGMAPLRRKKPEWQ